MICKDCNEAYAPTAQKKTCPHALIQGTELTEGEILAIKRGNAIDAIKSVRQRFPMGGLKGAKDIVDAYRDKNDIPRLQLGAAPPPWESEFARGCRAGHGQGFNDGLEEAAALLEQKHGTTYTDLATEIRSLKSK